MQSRILTDEQIARIHNASLAILEKIGKERIAGATPSPIPCPVRLPSGRFSVR